MISRTRKTAFRSSPWLTPQSRALTYDPSGQTFGTEYMNSFTDPLINDNKSYTILN